jgi:diguanylate cyclase (GGDEF)-like protein
MTLHLTRLPKLLFERRSSAVFGVALIAMLWAGIALKYFDDARSDRREAERTGSNFAMVFEENVLRSIGEIDKALLYLRRTIETRKDNVDFHTIVSTTDVLSEIIVQVAVIDANGIMRASNVGPQPAPPMDLSDREHYRVHVNKPEDMLFISKPLIGRASNKWSVQFTRRLSNRDGSFGGVVVASLNPEHFTNFYNSIDFGSPASIALIGSDGVVRSSGGRFGGFELGQDLGNTALMECIHSRANTTFENIDRSTGAARLVTVRAVRGRPLWVSVSSDMNEIYRSSRAGLQVNSLAAVIVTLIFLAAMERLLKSEANARQKADQLQLTLENMSQGIMLVTNDLRIPIINSKCTELLDLPSEFIRNPPRFDELVAYQARAEAQRRSDPDKRELTRCPQKNERTNIVTVSDRVMPDGSVIEVRTGHLLDGSFVQTFTDITKRREAENHIARLASEDSLTGLPNRRIFRSILEEFCRRHHHAAAGEHPQLAVLFLDVDRFKIINDTLGHRIGDLLLQQVATRLREALRTAHVLARLSGDEFAVVVPSFQSRDEIETIARSILSTFERPFDLDGYQICAGISIGIALAPTDGFDVDSLLVAADLALYSAKAKGRGTFNYFHSSMIMEVNDRREIETDLRAAIGRNELELHYQPIINLSRNEICGFEALARWRHPVKGLVPPTLFIPVAEDSGLIVPIGEWALKEACRTAANWPSDLKVAVNLSPVQLLTPNLPDVIERILAEARLAPNRLEIEITERIIMEENDCTLATLRKLKDLGVRIAMDDFGTGYSSLSYLRSFPFDKIKIDRSFVSDLVDGTDKVVIVQAVVSIARALGMITTAEGVELAYQEEFLTALGCDEAQGYLFSEAVPVERIAKILAEWETCRPIAA